jgi:hypothetical protein
MVPLPYSLVIAPGEQCGAGRRTNRSCMEAVVADALVRKPRECRCVSKAAEGVRHAEASVVDEYDQHVRRAFGQAVRLHATFMNGLLQALAQQYLPTVQQGKGSTEPSSCANAMVAEAKQHSAASSVRMVFINRSYFFRYLICVAPIVPLNSNGAWSK